MTALSHTGAWQDIATAPKDGTALVLYSRDAAEPNVFIGGYSDYDADSDDPFQIYWFDAWTGEAIDVEPTHWLLIPEPPGTGK